MQAPNQIPMNDLGRGYARYGTDVERVALETLRSGWWINGPRCTSFAKAFASYVGVSHCIPVANGTDALELAMRALRCAPGSEIITVANAGGYTTTACRQAGLVPVFADIEEASQLLSIPSAVDALSERTAAIVVTHLYGNVVDVGALKAAMTEAGFAHVPIIEDCAQSHGARGNGRLTGSLGDIATFSFYPTKNLGAMGDGGAVVTNDPELAETLRHLHQYGWSRKYEIAMAGGRNSRMDEMQAAILETILPRLDELNAERQQIVDRYLAASGRKVRFIERNEGAIIHLAVALADDRDGFRQHLSSRAIASDVHYPVLDVDQKGWSDLPARTSPTGLPVARSSTSRIVSLPCFPGMTEGEIARVADAIADWESS